MSLINEDISKIVHDIAIEISLKEWRYTRKKFDSMAQNYFGVLIPLHLSGKIADKLVDIEVVLKLAPNDERFRVSGAITAFFTREIFVYTHLLPKYRDLQNNYPFPLRYVMPSCYYICNEYCHEAIVLQNMCQDGYMPHTETFLDINHVTVALQSLAKFHALSFIFELKEPEKFNEVSEKCLPLSEKNNKRFLDVLKDRLSKAIMQFGGTDYVSLLEKLLENCESLVKSATLVANKTCICHGDIWKENILFKYEDGTPVSACLIDYQTARVCSPAYDMLYLIISSTDTDLRKKYFFSLLNTYYQTIEQMLNQAGFEAQLLYSRQMFESDLKIVCPAVFILANTGLWLANGMQQEGHVRSRLIVTTEEDKIKVAMKYQTLIKDIIDDLYSYGYLNKDLIILGGKQ